MTTSNDLEVLNMIFNPQAGYASVPKPQHELSEDIELIDPNLLSKVKALEVEGVKLAEDNKFDLAIEKFNKAIKISPRYGSVYNNRAQVLRIQEKDEGALQDLEHAIKYARDDYSILKQAYTQRGIIKKKKGDVAGSELDFQMGARYGNEIAKGMVKDNPYAKL